MIWFYFTACKFRKENTTVSVNKNRSLFPVYVSRFRVVGRRFFFHLYFDFFTRGLYRRGKTQSAYVNVRIKIHLPSIIPRPVRSFLVDEKPMEIQVGKRTMRKENDGVV